MKFKIIFPDNTLSQITHMYVGNFLHKYCVKYSESIDTIKQFSPPVVVIFHLCDIIINNV